MAPRFADTAGIAGYHAHVYYEPATRPAAERLRHAIGERFAGTLGRRHDQPIGPHPPSTHQVAFDVPRFPRLGPGRRLNRPSLTLVVQPRTRDASGDHARLPVWPST